MGVEPAGRVADHHVGTASLGSGDAVVGDRARVPALRAADDLSPGSVGPLGELLDRRRAIGVGGRNDHVQAELLLQMPGDLADRRRLAGAVDADDHQHGRGARAGRSGRRRRPRATRSQRGPRSAVRAARLRRSSSPASTSSSSRLTTAAVVWAPTSARISASSRCSQVDSSMRSVKLEESSAVSACRLRGEPLAQPPEHPGALLTQPRPRGTSRSPRSKASCQLVATRRA